MLKKACKICQGTSLLPLDGSLLFQHPRLMSKQRPNASQCAKNKYHDCTVHHAVSSPAHLSVNIGFMTKNAMTHPWPCTGQEVVFPFPPAVFSSRKTIFLPQACPPPPTPCQIKHGSSSIEQPSHKPDRSAPVPLPCGAYIPAGHFHIPARHAAQRAFPVRHGHGSRQ